MPRRDDALLLDMLIAARKIQTYAANLTEQDFESSDLVQSAVIREFQVIGEAARMMSGEGKEAHKAIPWAVIAGMRNRLIHEYFAIRVDVVWETIQKNIPQLIEQLEAIVNQQQNDEA